MSLSDKDIEEIISELNINDIYYMLYIASKWFERMKKTEYMLRRIASQLGLYRSSTGGEDLIKTFIREELSKALGTQAGTSEVIEIEESPERQEKLRRVIEMVKKKEKREEKPKEDKKEDVKQ
jgi:hypothetical protein